MTAAACKLDHVANRHGITPPESYPGDLDRYLLDRWTGVDGREAVGYRYLADWFNKRVLRSVYEEHGRDTMRVRVESEYDALQGGDEIDRQEVRDDLAASGIDPDGIERDFVSRGTVRNHLKDCLDGQKPTGARTDWEPQSVELAVEQAETKVRKALSALESKGRFTGGTDAGVDVRVDLRCAECDLRVPFDEAIQKGFVCEEHDFEPGNEVVPTEVDTQSLSVALLSLLVPVIATYSHTVVAALV